MHLPHARRQEPLSMRQPKFKSWPAWHKRLQVAIHLFVGGCRQAVPTRPGPGQDQSRAINHQRQRETEILSSFEIFLLSIPK